MNDTPTEFRMPHITDVAWCPGCGSNMLQKAIHSALHESKIETKELLVLSGGELATKTLDDRNANMCNERHDRSRPAKPGVKLSDKKLVVIVHSGDATIAGDGDNYFLQALRRSADVTVIVHNNMISNLNNAQTSLALPHGMKTPAQINGVKLKSINPLEVALAMNARFIARGLVRDVEQTTLMIMEAIAFRGFSVVDICQPCVLFNKLNTCLWFKKNIHYLPKGYDATDRNAAFRLAAGSGKLPLGVFFRKEERELYEEPIGHQYYPALSAIAT